ncbi:MAG TPA: hypothetical protein VHA77_02295 [Xanthobacteraceae bacterium]|nr:hypothetical protein [Xanthobacteraceae bacterium]
MSMPFPAVFVRRVLLLDAATCVGMGVLLTGFSSALAPVLGLSAALLFWAGLLLIPSAALMVLAASGERFRPALGRLVVLGNAVWVVASFAVLLETEPTLLGSAFVIAQAIVVAGIAALEWRGIQQAAVDPLVRA